jgi:hypothetical protein
MNEELFEPSLPSPHPFHPLDLIACYSILDSMTEDELLEFCPNSLDAYRIANNAFMITE